MGLDDLLKLERWIETLIAINKDMRGYTGGCTSYRVGTININSSKQKPSKKITTESQVVPVYEYIPTMIHMTNIFLGQG